MNKLLVFLGVMLIASCCKDDSPDPEIFIFGEAYGMCGGDCAHLYKIRGDLLFADNTDNYYSGNLTFQPTYLPDSHYQAAKHLPAQLPASLANGAGGTLGCPDCYDQGLLHLEFRRGNDMIRWKLDRNISSLPPEVQDYAQEVIRVLDELR